MLKRGVVGTFDSVSRQHLARYCDEFSFRWNHRRIDDGIRTALAIQGGDGKRLLYHSLLRK
ncbi:transposase [candidate division KSB1 bacterium]